MHNGYVRKWECYLETEVLDGYCTESNWDNTKEMWGRVMGQ